MSLTRLIKVVVSGAYFLWLRAVAACRRLTGKARPTLTILYYHAVRQADAPAFERQMTVLRSRWEVVAADRDEPLPGTGDAVAVTFDDAFESVYSNAVPVLERLGMVATVFVPVGFIGRAPGWGMETDQDAREVVAGGERIRSAPVTVRHGSHTMSHPRLSTLGDEDLIRELEESRTRLSSLMGQPVDTIAFPYGDHDGRVVKACADAGYRHAFSIRPERVHPDRPNLLRGRTSVDPRDTAVEFYLKAAGAYAWVPIASRMKRLLKRPRIR
jgi:peptidoglycan/xylan/chitin deacetylase (PgdA/CDA1 family)